MPYMPEQADLLAKLGDSVDALDALCTILFYCQDKPIPCESIGYLLQSQVDKMTSHLNNLKAL